LGQGDNNTYTRSFLIVTFVCVHAYFVKWTYEVLTEEMG